MTRGGLLGGALSLRGSIDNALGGYLAARGDENLPRWDGRRRGHYEAWYLTFNVPGEEAAFWLRYTLDAPDRGEVRAELWGHLFDGRAPDLSFGLRQRFGLTDLALGGEALVRIGAASLAEGRAAGALSSADHALSWELRFDPSPTALFIAPRLLRPLLARRATQWCVPNLDVRFEGRVVADGRTFELARAPGQQAHLFGGRHAERWAWVHCNAFDGSPGTVVEGVAATVAGLGRTLTALYVRHAGRHHLCQALPWSLAATSSRAPPEWTFRCRSGDLALEGRVRGEFAKMLQVTYEDPDGTRSYCCNTELGDLTLTLRQGSRVETLTATGTAHLEFGDREPNPSVRHCPAP